MLADSAFQIVAGCHSNELSAQRKAQPVNPMGDLLKTTEWENAHIIMARNLKMCQSMTIMSTLLNETHKEC
jgi:hypothetical protein